MGSVPYLASRLACDPTFDVRTNPKRLRCSKTYNFSLLCLAEMRIWIGREIMDVTSSTFANTSLFDVRFHDWNLFLVLTSFTTVLGIVHDLRVHFEVVARSEKSLRKRREAM
jgi:hypothetical protein